MTGQMNPSRVVDVFELGVSQEETAEDQQSHRKYEGPIHQLMNKCR